MVEKETVRSGYDQIGGEYAEWRVFDTEEQRVFERFLDSLPPEPRILDAGCGNGQPILNLLTDRFHDHSPIGLDLSTTQLALAAEQTNDARLIQGDVTRLPLSTSSVDGVVAFHSLIHVPADQHQQAIEECARVVQPEGRVLLSEGLERWEGTNPDWLETGATMEWHIAGADTTRRQIRDAGLAIETEWTVSDVLVDGESWIFFDAVPQ